MSKIVANKKGYNVGPFRWFAKQIGISMCGGAFRDKNCNVGVDNRCGRNNDSLDKQRHDATHQVPKFNATHHEIKTSVLSLRDEDNQRKEEIAKCKLTPEVGTYRCGWCG
jgi:hypothetical protein